MSAKEQKQLCGKKKSWGLVKQQKTQCNSVFLPNFSKFMLMFWVRSCDSGSRSLSFGWTGPITRGPSALVGFRPLSQIDVREHNSTWTVACAARCTLELPASFDLQVVAALWCCCWPSHMQFATHNYFVISPLGLLHLPVQLFFFCLQLAVNNCRYYDWQIASSCVFFLIYIRRIFPDMIN